MSKNRQPRSIRFYMMLSILPLTAILLFSCFYLRMDLDRVSENTEIILSEAIPSFENTQQALAFFTELDYCVNTIGTASREDEAAKAYVTARNLLREYNHLVTVRDQLTRIGRNLRWMMRMRQQLDETRSKMLSAYQITYLYLLDIHFSEGVPFDITRSTFMNHNVLHSLHENDLRFVDRIKENAEPFVQFCARTDLDLENVRRCATFNVAYEDLLQSCLTLFRVSRDIDSLHNSTAKLISSSGRGFATSEMDVISSDLEDIKQTATFYKNLITLLMVGAILLLILHHAALQIVIVRPLTYLSNIIHNFAAFREIPARFKPSQIKELREIEAVLPSMLTEVQRTASQNDFLKKVNQDLRDISLIDELTQVHNRRAFRNYAHEHEKATSSYVILMVDIDFFKAFNDTLGHLMGDEVLVKTASALASHVDKGDVVFRYGGEEFCVVLNGITLEEAVGVGDRLRQAISELGIYNPALQRNLSISVGVSSQKPTGVTDQPMSFFVAQADAALYEAKKQGRNCTCLYTEDLEMNPKRELKEAS